MSAATLEPPGMIDISAPPGPVHPPGRRRAAQDADTRAGLWLLIAIGVITAAIIVIFFSRRARRRHTLPRTSSASTATPQGFLLPVLGILLVTSEWGQRTALTTFALEPPAGRVIGAKVVAALLVGVAAIAIVAGVLAALAPCRGGTEPGSIGVDDFAKFGLLQVSGDPAGPRVRPAVPQLAAAIVTYFVLPIAFSIIAIAAELMHWFDSCALDRPGHLADAAVQRR